MPQNLALLAFAALTLASPAAAQNTARHFELTELSSFTIPSSTIVDDIAGVAGQPPLVWSTSPSRLQTLQGDSLATSTKVSGRIVGVGYSRSPTAEIEIFKQTLSSSDNAVEYRVDVLTDDSGSVSDRYYVAPAQMGPYERALRVARGWFLLARLAGDRGFAVYFQDVPVRHQKRLRASRLLGTWPRGTSVSSTEGELLVGSPEPPFKVYRLQPSGEITRLLQIEPTSVEELNGFALGDDSVEAIVRPVSVVKADSLYIYTLSELTTDRRLIAVFDTRGNQRLAATTPVPLAFRYYDASSRCLYALRWISKREIVCYEIRVIGG